MKFIISTLLIASVLLVSCSTSNVKEPEYRDVRNIHLVELGVLQSTAGIDLVFYNPNSFGVQLSEAWGDVYIDNAYVGKFTLDQKVQVKKKSDFVVPALLKVDMIGVIKNQKDLYKKKEALIKIDGFARVKKTGFSKEIPIKFESLENIEKFRGLISKD